MDEEIKSAVGPYDTFNIIMKRILKNFPKDAHVVDVARYAVEEYMTEYFAALDEIERIKKGRRKT